MKPARATACRGEDQKHLSVLLPVVLNFQMQFREIDL